VSVFGSVTAAEDFDADSKVTLLPCVRGSAGQICFDKYAQDAGNICNLILSTGSACGTAGDYTIETEFELPEEVKNINWMWNMITVKVLVGDEEVCEQNAATSAYFTVGFASLFAVGGMSLYFMRRKKRPLIVLDDDAEGEGQHRFVEMKDTCSSRFTADAMA
jgi:hypothetical protein